tara:strand:- start:157 stop:393 length:237 start_codon:yes stop_codon:yes gene_type:complete
MRTRMKVTYYPCIDEFAEELHHKRLDNKIPKRITKKFCLEILKFMSIKYIGLEMNDYHCEFEEEDYKLAEELTDKYNL